MTDPRVKFCWSTNGSTCSVHELSPCVFTGSIYVGKKHPLRKLSSSKLLSCDKRIDRLEKEGSHLTIYLHPKADANEAKTDCESVVENLTRIRDFTLDAGHMFDGMTPDVVIINGRRYDRGDDESSRVTRFLMDLTKLCEDHDAHIDAIGEAAVRLPEIVCHDVSADQRSAKVTVNGCIVEMSR